MYEVERRVNALEAERRKLERELKAMRQNLNEKITLTKKEQEQLFSRLQVVNPDFSKRLKQRAPKISPAEFKVAHLIRGAMTTKKIAKVLQVSERTVETHRQNIRRKLGVPKGKELSAFLCTM